MSGLGRNYDGALDSARSNGARWNNAKSCEHTIVRCHRRVLHSRVWRRGARADLERHRLRRRVAETALDDVTAEWRKKTGKTLRISYAASGAPTKQIEAGAPADIFISADVAWMDYLPERKLIKAETRRDLLDNTLVLVAPGDSKAPPMQIDAQTDLLRLLDKDERLAMGQPKSVPAGAYAEQALASLGLWERVKDRIAQTESVRATLVFVARGEAPLGIVYRSDAHAEPRVKVLGTFPESSHAPIVSPVAIIAASANSDAKAFYDYLPTPAASAIFRRECFHRVD